MNAPARRAALFGSAYALIGLAFLPRRLDLSALTYAVAADRGLGKVHAAAHPLYLPVLRVALALARALGWRGAVSPPAQIVSALAGGLAAGLLLRLAERLSGDRRAAFVGTVAFVGCGHVWGYGLQSKPYTLAAACAAAYFLALTSRRPATAARGALAGAFAGLTLGFDAMSMSLIPVAWVWAGLQPRARRARFLAALHGVFAAFALAYLATFPRGPIKTFDAMYSPARIYDSVLAGSSWEEQWSDYVDWTRLHLWDLFLPLPALAMVLAGGAAVDRLRRRRAVALAAAMWGTRALSGLVFHANDDFIHAAWLLLPCALAAAARRRPLLTGALAASAAVVAASGFVLRVEAPADPVQSRQRLEADFLARGLGRDGLLVIAGQPDWSVLDALTGRVRAERLDGAADLFSPLAAAPDPAAVALAAAAAASGRRVWIAGDSLYRPDFSRAALDVFQDRAVKLLGRSSFFGAPVWSPIGQRYLPLLARRPRKALKPPLRPFPVEEDLDRVDAP